jgi:hypothetical protein
MVGCQGPFPSHRTLIAIGRQLEVEAVGKVFLTIVRTQAEAVLRHLTSLNLFLASEESNGTHQNTTKGQDETPIILFFKQQQKGSLLDTTLEDQVSNIPLKEKRDLR